jgi:PAS domain S-box-containing protein
MTGTPTWLQRRRAQLGATPTPRISPEASADPSTQAAILNATGSIVVVVDITSGNVVGMNKPTEIVTGFSPEEMVDRPLWVTIMATEDQAAMRAAYEVSVEAGLPLAYECTVATKSGEPRRVVWSGEFLRDADGSRTHLVMTGIDVTAIRSTAGLFGHLMRAATTTAFVGTDRQGVVTFFSSGAEEMLGYPASDMLGRPFPMSFFEETQFQARAAEMELPADLRILTLADGRPDSAAPDPRRSHGFAPHARDWTMVRRDGTELTVSLSVDPVTDSSGRLVGHLGVGHDVTEQRTTEHLLFSALEMEHEAVERLRKLDQEKTEFVATVSHELRTPMASITGYTELLQDGSAGELNPEQREFVAAISRNSDRLTALADDLLTLSSLEAGTFRHQLRDVDLGAVLTAVHTQLQAAIEAKLLEVDFVAPPEPVVVLGDAPNLERMVVNLVGNALKFTEEGGWVHCSVEALGSQARLVVRDNGIGIPESEQGELFTRFFRSSNALEHAIQGSGLGLTIVESIVTSHGGDISVFSAENQGTTFTVHLPLKGAQRTPDAAQFIAKRSDSA